MTLLPESVAGCQVARVWGTERAPPYLQSEQPLELTVIWVLGTQKTQ